MRTKQIVSSAVRLLSEQYFSNAVALLNICIHVFLWTILVLFVFFDISVVLASDSQQCKVSMWLEEPGNPGWSEKRLIKWS